MNRNKKIFVLDSESDQLEKFNDLLESENAEIEGFLDREKLINRLKSFFPDIIAISMCSAQDENIKLINKLRKHPIYSQIPLILYLPNRSTVLSTKYGNDRMINFIDYPLQVSQIKTCLKKSEILDKNLVAEIKGVGTGDGFSDIKFTYANKSVIKGSTNLKLKDDGIYKIKLDKIDNKEHYLFNTSRMEPSGRVNYNNKTGVFDVEFFIKGIHPDFLLKVGSEE